LARLHAARWSSRDQPGVLADAEVEAFHREAGAGLMARGVMRGYRLVVGGRVAAVYHGFQHRDRASYYLGGFDPELGARGVGNQIVWHALGCAHEEGARVFDFLRGREAYKYRWGAVDVPAFRRRLHQRREHPPLL
jgi:CelD/BcsL family acetyltransferase involved in cellulose biosynthesis